MPETAKKPRRKLWLLDAFLILLVVVGVQWWQARDAVRGPAPALAGSRLDGSAFDLQAALAAQPGRPQLIYFWAEWCPVCKTTAGTVDKVAADWPLTSVAVQSGPPEKVAATMRERGYAWPTLADPDGTLLARYGLHGVPALVIVGADGNVRSVSLGYTSEPGLRLRLWWAARGA
jgi:thiol-disulfide isomerase/thioredoxin